MASLSAQTGSAYEQIDLHGTVDPSDVQPEVNNPNTGTIKTDSAGDIYESIPEDRNPKIQIYETIHLKKQAQNPKEQGNDKGSSLQPIYQSLVLENQNKPVYESLNTKTKLDQTQESET